MAKVSFGLEFNKRYAFVYSVVSIDGGRVKQGFETWKSLAILKFLFDGKVVRVKDGGLVVEAGEEDVKFFEFLREIDAYKRGVWKRVVEMLEEGRSKWDVLDYLASILWEIRRKGWVECYFCGLTFTNERELEEHMARSHTWSLRW